MEEEMEEEVKEVMVVVVVEEEEIRIEAISLYFLSPTFPLLVVSCLTLETADTITPPTHTHTHHTNAHTHTNTYSTCH